MAAWQQRDAKGIWTTMTAVASAALEETYLRHHGRGVGLPVAWLGEDDASSVTGTARHTLNIDGERMVLEVFGGDASGRSTSSLGEGGTESFSLDGAVGAVPTAGPISAPIRRVCLQRVYRDNEWAWESYASRGQAQARATPYDPIHQRQINAAYRAGKGSVDITVHLPGGGGAAALTIDFAKMTQYNPDTGRTRSVRRLATLRPLPGDRRVDASTGGLVYLKRARSPSPAPAPAPAPTGDTSTTTPDPRALGGNSRPDGGAPPRSGATTTAAAAAAPATTEPSLSPSLSPQKLAKRPRLVAVDPDQPRPGMSGEGSRPADAVPHANPPPAVATTDAVVDNWRVDPAAGVMVLEGSGAGAEKIAGFDLDDTLITTQSGKTFPTSPADWKLLHPAVPDVLARLRRKGYKIVIFTNQGGIGRGGAFLKSKAAGIRGKILDVSRALGFSIQAYVATGYGQYRKPACGAWEAMERGFNGGVRVDRGRSFYCGDAAGRSIRTLAGRQSDFSCGDRKFAANLDVAFFTPEELFLRETPVPHFWGTAFNPQKHRLPLTPTEDGRTVFHASSPEVIVNVGPPGAGKTTFTRKHFLSRGYVHVNRDTLKTAARCERALRAALAAGHSAVVDNTSPGAATRAVYIDIARAAGVPVRCMHFVMDIAHAQHLNAMRDIVADMTCDPHAKSHVPQIAFIKFQSALQAPLPQEGFAEVLEIRFCAEFPSEAHRVLYHQYLLP